MTMDFAGLPGPNVEPEEWLRRLQASAIPPSKTTAQGVAVSGAVVFLSTVAWAYGLNVVAATAIAIAAIAYFFCAKTKLPLGFVGVRLFLGLRASMEAPVLTESASWGQWTPWPFVTVRPVNMQERVSDLPLLVIIVGGDSGRPAAVIIDGVFNWYVWNPVRVLSVGESVIVAGLLELVLDRFREYGTNHAPEDLLKSLDGLRDDAIKHADEKSDKWGIKVTDSRIRTLQFANRKVLEAFELATSEKAKAKATEHMVKSIKDYAKNLNLGERDAAILNAVERGKPMEVIWTSPGADRMTRAAATHASINRKGGGNATPI